MNLDPGTVVQQRFRIDRAISSGGMGEVYRAVDLQTGSPVALKRMLLELGGEERELIERKFLEEVQVLARLDFPGIPRFVADFVLDGSRCIVMEFIQGTDLEVEVRDRAALVGERGLPVQPAVETVIEICRIVEYLHSLRPHPIIHRDIKPANIIRRDDGRVYLVDFGLARDVRESEAKQTKTMVGTVGYAPLEQFQGKPEQRSDLYSLGVTLHFLLSAESPIPFQIPPLTGVHPELARIVRTATLTDMDLRFASVFDFRRELEAVVPLLAQAVEAPPTVVERSDWSELLQRGQRQKLEGVHAPPAEEQWGTTDPLARQDADAFTRAALETLRADAPAEEERRGSWRWLVALVLLVGLGVGGYFWQQRAWAGRISAWPIASVSGLRFAAGSAAVFRAPGTGKVSVRLAQAKGTYEVTLAAEGRVATLSNGKWRVDGKALKMQDDVVTFPFPASGEVTIRFVKGDGEVVLADLKAR